MFKKKIKFKILENNIELYKSIYGWTRITFKTITIKDYSNIRYLYNKHEKIDIIFYVSDFKVKCKNCYFIKFKAIKSFDLIICNTVIETDNIYI